MSRQVGLLAGLAVVLILVGFYFFAFKPRSEELVEVREQIDTAVAQQATLEAEIAALQAIRAEAPEIEAALATAESVIPRDLALPSALRQLQLAADDAGLSLETVAPGRPVASDLETPELATVTISVTLSGSYFQVVDFLRRVEDPTIIPRGIEWTSALLTPSAYPTLSVVLSGEMYSLLPAPVPAPTETAPDVPAATEAPPAPETEAAA